MATVTETHPPVADLPPSKDEISDDTAAIAKALGHPARIQIVRLLLEKQACFGCDNLGPAELISIDRTAKIVIWINAASSRTT